MHGLTADPQLSVVGIAAVGNDTVFGDVEGPAQAAVQTGVQGVANFGGGDGRLGHTEAAQGGDADAVEQPQLILRDMAAANDDLLQLRSEELGVDVGKHMPGLLETPDRVDLLHTQGQLLGVPEFFLHFRGFLGHPFLQGAANIVDQQRHDGCKLHLQRAAGAQDGVRRPVTQENLGVTQHPGPDHIGHKAEDVVEGQKAQRTQRSPALLGDLFVGLLVDDGLCLQADGTAPVDIDFGRVGGAGGAEGQLIRPVSDGQRGVAVQQCARLELRQRDPGPGLGADQGVCIGLPQQVEKLPVVQHRVQQQRLASGGYQSPEDHGPVTAGLQCQSDPFAPLSAAKLFDPSAAAQDVFLHLPKAEAAFLIAFQPVGGRCFRIGAEEVEKAVQTVMLFQQPAFLFTSIFHSFYFSLFFGA